MKSPEVLQVIIIIAGILIGAHFSKLSYGLHEKDGHTELSSHSAMDHGIIDVTNDSVIPQIEKIEIIKDSISGWNLHLQTNNFKFTPESVNKNHKQGEGHAHLYINGSKIARLYNGWFHLPELVKGETQIEITLNANSHEIMFFNNKPISKTIIF